MNAEEVFRQYDQMSEAFDNKVRYVIRGKVGTKYEGLAYGMGIVSESSNQVFLYEDMADAEQAMKDLIVKRKEQSGQYIGDMLEIHEVHKDELYTTYLKANIL